MTIAYAAKGLLGVFTPQANTTVEPELALLMPPGYAWINARMMSSAPTISARLLDYMAQFPDHLRQFANAPIDAVAIGCTGASYLLGREREDALLGMIEAHISVPAFTGASASVDALVALGASRIALVSPYDSELDIGSAAYWRSRGFEIVAEASAFRETAQFHPIYSLETQAAEQALAKVPTSGVNAVLMLGTGMPTLDAISRNPFWGDAPVLSCMLCLAWKAVALREPQQATGTAVLEWVKNGRWRENLLRARSFATCEGPGAQ